MNEDNSNKHGETPDRVTSVEVTDAGHAAEETKANEAKATNHIKKFPPKRFMELPQAIRWGLIAPAIGLMVLAANLIRWHHEDTVRAQAASHQATISVAAAMRAAAEATASALNVRAFELDRRANIEADMMGPDEIVVGKNFFTLIVTSTGKSNVDRMTRVRFGTALTRSGDRPIYPKADENALETDTVAPTDKRTIRIAVELNDSNVELINHRDQELAIYTTLRYWDGFHCRRVNLCAAYRPKSECPGACGPAERRTGSCGHLIEEQEEDPPERCGHPVATASANVAK